MIRNETIIAAGIGAWIGSVVSVFLTKEILPTDQLLDIVWKGGILTLAVTILIFIILKFLKI